MKNPAFNCCIEPRRPQLDAPPREPEQRPCTDEFIANGGDYERLPGVGGGVMDKMTDSRAVEVLSEMRALTWACGADATHLIAHDEVAALDCAIARLREPAGVGGEFDAEAVAWAYGKLRDFGCYTRESGAMMGDRLNMMLLDPPAAHQPPAEAQAQGGGEVESWQKVVLCPECRGAGGRRWHEADGSERGERCGTCDGFGHVNAPPSAPVGVDGFDAWWKSHSIDPEFPETMDDRTFAKAAWDAALAQQPAAVDVAALREAADYMWSRAKWEACDCGCPNAKRPVDAASVAWIRAAAMVRSALHPTAEQEAE